jgi:hypothetical protein
VPALVAELNRATSDGYQRLLIMSLRLIKDPRAVPALIRAVPRVALVSSDFGFEVQDEALQKWLSERSWDGKLASQQLRMRPDGKPRTLSFFNRAITELVGALEAITGHSEGHAPITAGPSGMIRDDEATRAGANAPRAQFARRWQTWWDENREKLVTDADMKSLDAALYADDIVKAVGLAKYGPLFPVGPDVRLGPVHEVVLPASRGWDSRSYLDLDTGVILARNQGWEDGVPEDRNLSWSELSGYEVSVSIAYKLDERDVPRPSPGSTEVQAWQIPDERFDAIDAEVKDGGELDLGKRLVRSGFEWRPWFEYPATFLFITMQNSRGIIQFLGPSEEGKLDIRLRYRLWEGGATKPAPLAEQIAASLRPTTARVQRWVEVHEVTLYKPQAAGKPSAIDFDTGQIRTRELEADDPRASQAKRDWLGSWGGDAMTMIDGKLNMYGMDAPGTRTLDVIFGGFDSLTPHDANTLLARSDFSFGSFRKGGNDSHIPVDWIFQTKQGRRGILRIDQLDTEVVKFRYKLIEPIP